MHCTVCQRLKGKVIHLLAIHQMKSAGFILWGMLSSFFGIALCAIAFYFAEDSSNSYLSSRKSEDIFQLLVIFGFIFILLGAVLQITGIYRAFRTFDAVGAKYIFESYSEQPYAWGLPVSPELEVSSSVGPDSEVSSPTSAAPESHPFYGASATNMPNSNVTSGK